jgi:Abortive infection C-terminus
VISKEFELLCDKEYGLACREAYEGLDRELANIKEQFAHCGMLVSSPRAQAVADAVLTRFDAVLEGFERSHLGKWADGQRQLEESDYEWLKATAMSKLDGEVREVRSRVQSELWERTLSFVRYWEQAEVEARTRRTKVLEKIEILRLQKREGTVLNQGDSSSYRLLPKASELFPLPVVVSAKELFAGQTGMSGPQIFEFFSRYSEEIGKMRYGSGVPSRKEIFVNFLESLPIELQRKVLLELCNGLPMKTPPPQTTVDDLRAKISGTPVPGILGKAVEAIDVAHVTKQWEKLTARLSDDPEGAITSARSLLESVCLHVLQCLGKSIDHAGDLPALYKAAAEGLQLVAKKEDEIAIRQILGSCSGIAQGVAALRNQFGDAHGRLGPDAEKRLAHLAANAVGALCTFLIESLEAARNRGSQATA